MSLSPSPDQILLFNPRLWTFGQASRSGPGAGGWWAHRETYCWAERFSGADRQEAAQKLCWPAFASICYHGSPTRTAWCRGLRLWIGPVGTLSDWPNELVFLSFFLFITLFSPLPPSSAATPIFHKCTCYFSVTLHLLPFDMHNARQNTLYIQLVLQYTCATGRCKLTDKIVLKRLKSK